MPDRPMSKMTAVTVFIAVTAIASAANSKIVPAPLFTDNAVLQQIQSDPVWGTADPGEPITVSINGQTATTKADNSGNWLVKLKPLSAGGPFTLTIAGNPGDTITLNNVLVGEVWLASGQSNMEYPLKGFNGKAPTLAAAANATDNLLHFVIIPRTASLTPQTTVPAAWQVESPDTIVNLSAVGYFFGRDLRQSEKVPIGIIGSYWGGTNAQAWTDRSALASNPLFKLYLDTEATAVQTYPDRLKAYNDQLPTLQQNYAAAQAKYQTDAAAAKAAGTPPPVAPKAPQVPGDPAAQPLPTHLYNGMIAPLIPYGIKGAIWYQGESNAGDAYRYQTLFPTMIADWRKNWGEGDFPFLFVQLAPFQKISPQPIESAWAELREAQRLALQTSPNTGMAVITDIGDQGNVHPTRKEPVGDRLALLARALVYKENVEYSGPVYQGIAVDGSKVRVTFTHAEGLHSIQITDVSDAGTIVAPTDQVVGFEVAGSDGKYYAADATIDGSAVVVSSASVATPVSVRYGWANYPTANLANSAGLMASPFTTDSLPWLTTPKVPGPVPAAPTPTPAPVAK